MKTIRLALLLMLLAGSVGSFAQSKLYVGVNGGYTAATADLFHSVNAYNWENGFIGGFQGGLVVMNFFVEHLGFQSGLTYVQKGWRQKFDDDVPDHITNLDYIELPMMAHLYSGKGNFHLYINGGIYFEYMVNSRVDPAPTPEEIGGYDFYLFDEDRDNKYGYGFKVGGGVYFDFPFGTIMAEGSGSYSLSRVFDYDRLSTGIPNLSNKINAAVTLGYLMRFGSFSKD